MMRRWRRLRAQGLRGDAGIGTLEYLGIVTLAVLLVTALILSMTSFRLGEHVEAAVCRITQAVGAGGD